MNEKKHMTITRRDARERAMQVLYAYEVSQEPLEMLFETIAGPELESDADQYKFAQGLVYTVLNNRATTDEFIIAHSHNWEFERIALIDKILLRMGIVEFLYFADIPTKVTINECVEIAKRYSTEQSGKFVNGILDNILQHLGESGRIQKTGRGLIDRTI
jgi:transcription antitermination protein NusB